MKTNDPVKVAIDAVLSTERFSRRSTTWYRDLEETIVVVDLQKSNFGAQYYVNLGVFVKGLSSSPARHPPKENECHIRLRLGSTPEDQKLNQALNLEDSSIAPSQRENEVKRMMAEQALPLILDCSTRAGIRDAHRQGRLSRALIHKAVRDSILVEPT